MKTYIKIGITLGDPNGIGPEIILKTFSDLQNINDSIIVIYSPFEIIDYYIKFLDIKMDYNILKSAEEAKIGGVNLLPIDNGIFKVSMGVSNKASGAIAFQSLSAASKDLIQNNKNGFTIAVGDIKEICADLKTFKEKGDKIGKYTLDANDGFTSIVRFENGAIGTVTNTRYATGYANTLILEVFCEKGAVKVELDEKRKKFLDDVKKTALDI